MEDDASHLSTTSRLFGSAGVVKLENMEKKASRPLFLYVLKPPPPPILHPPHTTPHRSRCRELITHIHFVLNTTTRSLFDAACAVSACGCLVSLVVYNSPLQVQWKAADAPSSSHGGGSMDLVCVSRSVPRHAFTLLPLTPNT